MSGIFGGDEGSVSFQQSPLQQAIQALVMPKVQQSFDQGYAWDTPSSPQNFYDIPSTNQMMPQQGWMNNLDSGVKKGLWEPWEQGANQLGERFGNAGMGGSARGGMSGSAAAGFGKYYQDAAKDVGMQAWNMVQPAQQAGWGAELGRGRELAQERLTSQQYPWQMAPGLLGGSAAYPIVRQGTQGLFK